MTKCLLVDEDNAERRRLEELLSGLGVETALSAQADEALRYCNDNSPDVVMLSAAAPGVAPSDLVKRLQRPSGGGRPPVVFLYAETADTAMFGQSILEGAADVLMMPFDRDLLQFKLRQAGVIS
ncbi:MAG TPA: response regulator [Aestuariivirga sp.]|nr:response regulator [Alphaproteobacteria bacterium]HRX37269.1 response regulator [Aestuariivirga sp.]